MTFDSFGTDAMISQVIFFQYFCTSWDMTAVVCAPIRRLTAMLCSPGVLFGNMAAAIDESILEEPEMTMLTEEDPGEKGMDMQLYTLKRRTNRKQNRPIRAKPA